MISLTALICVFTFSSTDYQLSTEQQIAVLQEAQVAYSNGIDLQTSDPVAAKESFRRSANRFQLLVDDGIENGKLWYDLGNAQLQSDEIGEAIAAYRSAQRFIPSDGRVETNMTYARTLVANSDVAEDSVSILNRLAFWHDSLPTQLRIVAGISFWIACWVLLITQLFRRIPGFKTASISLGLVAVALSVSVGVDIADQHQEHGVLIAKDVIVRKGNGLKYAPIFQEPIHEGIEFEILGIRKDWLHIRLPNGSEGWIQRDDAQVVSLKDDAVTLG